VGVPDPTPGSGTLTLHLVVGARPNYPKVAALRRACLALPGVRPLLVHTGQHSSPALNEELARDLDLPAPDLQLPAVNTTGARRLSTIIRGYDTLLETQAPDVVVVVGDVDSTLACALAAARRRIPLAHVEAGLRCADRGMPEEQNRRLVDRLADRLYTHSAEATQALLAEGVHRDAIVEAGNVMIDTLIAQRSAAHPPRSFPTALEGRPFGVVTLHRPELVDRPTLLAPMIEALQAAARRLPLIFPVHPRTAQQLDQLGLRLDAPLHAVDPLPYNEFLWLMSHARLVITDSGGIQEETSFLGRPCLTVRPDTERPVTVRLGTNRVVGRDASGLLPAVRAALARPELRAQPTIPGWDGRAAARIVADLVRWRGLSVAA